MANVRPYGAAINDAIKRGDKAQIQQLLTQAKELRSQQGDLGKAIQDLEAAINKKKG